jgi:hypothetical protein
MLLLAIAAAMPEKYARIFQKQGRKPSGIFSMNKIGTAASGRLLSLKPVRPF